MKEFNIDELLDYINNGISDEEGNVRKFDIYDFYKLYKNEIDIVSYYKKNHVKFSYSNEKILRQWIINEVGYEFFADTSISEFTKNQTRIVKTLFAIDIFKNGEFDKDGNYIPGSGKLMTLEEKELAYNLLNQPGRIVSAKSFSHVLDRIAAGVDILADFNQIELVK